jgi:ligand-binding SRPBCC domain-containing protein
VTVERSSVLAAPAEAVWTRVTTLQGVNDELRPWLRMTAPRAVRDLSLADVELGRRVCRSWVLLGGVVPVDYDDLTLVERGPGLRFLERSPLLSQRSWQHERWVEAVDGGCRLTDRLTFEPRIAAAARVSRRVVAAIFAHRHRRLVRRFGALAG